jgi:hypothetical protein
MDIERFEESCRSKMLCRFCEGTGINDWDKLKMVTVYGKSLKEISVCLSSVDEKDSQIASLKELVREMIPHTHIMRPKESSSWLKRAKEALK